MRVETLKKKNTTLHLNTNRVAAMAAAVSFVFRRKLWPNFTAKLRRVKGGWRVGGSAWSENTLS